MGLINTQNFGDNFAEKTYLCSMLFDLEVNDLLVKKNSSLKELVFWFVLGR